MSQFLADLFGGLTLDTILVYMLALKGMTNGGKISLPSLPQFGNKAASGPVKK